MLGAVVKGLAFMSLDLRFRLRFSGSVAIWQAVLSGLFGSRWCM